MQILSLLVALLGTTLLSAEAAEQGHRMVKARRTASSLARRHADYTGHKLVKRAYSGRATFFDVGLGACGWYSSEDEAVVALAESIWSSGDDGSGNPNKNSWCGTSITISYGGVQKQATIVDLCPVNGGCTAEDGAALDLSRSLFGTFASMDLGIFQMEWWVNDGSGGGSSGGGNNDNSGQEEADAAAAASSSSAAAAAAAAASSSSAEAAAWAAAQSSSSAAAAAAAAASASSKSHEEWLSWNHRLSTSWDAVLSQSRVSVASESSASVAAARSARASRVKAQEASAAAEETVEMTAMPSASASRKATDNKLQEGADTLQSEDAPDGSVEAINAVALRMANLAMLYVNKES